MGLLLPFFLVYAGGILTALPAARTVLIPYSIPLILVVAAFLLIGKKKKGRSAKWALLACFFIFGFLAPGLAERFRPADHILHHLQEEKRAEVEGNLIAVSEVSHDRVRYIVELTSIRYGKKPIPVSGRARITLYSPENSLQSGDVVQIRKVRLKRPRNFKNPGRFDYESFMESLGISVTGGVSNPDSLKKIGSFPVSSFTKFREGIRNRMFAIIDQNLPREEGELLKAMLLGEKQSLSEEAKEDYRATGLAHLMAVSGLHIGFVAFAVYFLSYPLLFRLLCRYFPEAARAGKARKVVVFLTLFPVLFYVMLVGAKISALRAGMMVCVFLLAVLVDRGNKFSNALLLAAFALLLWRPKAIMDVSFQLSFMAVFTILFAAHFIIHEKKDAIDRLTEPGRFRKYLMGSVLVSFAAILGTLPILLLYFHRISLVGFILNPVLVPLAIVLIPLALLALALSLVWGPIFGIFMPLISVLLKIFLIVPHFFAALPYASMFLPTPPQLWFVLYYLTLFGSVYWFHQYRKDQKNVEINTPWLKPAQYGLIFGAVWVAVWLVWPRFPQFPSDKLTVSVIDVGGGESILVEFPNHKTLLIDGGGFRGGSFDVGQFVVAPFLWNRGIGKIDYMAATHSDQDHIGGLESVLNFFEVDYFLYQATAIKDARIERLRQNALKQDTVALPFKIGKPLQVGEVEITLLHPDAEFARREMGKGRDRIGNSLSLVFRLDYRQFSMLFTADIGEEEERYLIDNGAALRADYLKAPHHGSKFSNSLAFIQAVQPKAVFFSSGYLNTFHHPNPAVVERYRETGAQIWRTDLNGALHITTDGYEHHVHGHEDL